MELKKALTIEEQIDRLKNVHNLLINDDEEAAEILKTVNYYRLSAYGIGLTKKNNREEYTDGTSLSDIYRFIGNKQIISCVDCFETDDRPERSCSLE